MSTWVQSEYVSVHLSVCQCVFKVKIVPYKPFTIFTRLKSWKFKNFCVNFQKNQWPNKNDYGMAVSSNTIVGLMFIDAQIVAHIIVSSIVYHL